MVLTRVGSARTKPRRRPPRRRAEHARLNVPAEQGTLRHAPWPRFGGNQMRASATKLGLAAVVLAAALPSAFGQESDPRAVLLTGDALRNAIVGKYTYYPAGEG